MIETFDSLADMSVFSQSGGIAGGISQALFTTQMGLSVAVPGVIAALLLDRRHRALTAEIDTIKNMLCHRFVPIALQPSV
jgi:biopolymer transport protein ExbB